MKNAQKTSELVNAVQELKPLIMANSSSAENARELSREVYQAMFDANLFAMLLPRAYGGFEMHPSEAMVVWETVARIDSAAAWNLVMNGTISGFLAWLSDDGAREMLADGPTTVAGALFPPQPAVRVDGGWRVTGKVPFASGCAHAQWWGMPIVEMDGECPKMNSDTGEPVPRGVFFRREEGRTLDTWHTVGMRGTGSSDIAVQDLFVPDRRTIHVRPLESPASGFDGPLYRMVPWLSILGEATVSVGIAAATVDDVVQLVETKKPAYTTTTLRDHQLAQYQVAKARALVEASRDTLHAAAHEAYENAATGSLLSRESKVRLQLAVCFAAESCAKSVRLACDVAGASAIRTEQSFERHHRDIHVLTQHSSKSSVRYASAGRLMFGLDNDWVWLSF